MSSAGVADGSYTGFGSPTERANIRMWLASTGKRSMAMIPLRIVDCSMSGPL